jgi:hypothetical protein
VSTTQPDEGDDDDEEDDDNDEDDDEDDDDDDDRDGLPYPSELLMEASAMPMLHATACHCY